MFHSILKEQGLTVPKINAIVHNRSTIFADGAGQRLPRDEQQQGAGRTLYSAYKTAEEKGELDRIFNKEQLEQSKLHKIKFAEDFAGVFTGTMRDMLSSAIATQHLGIPLWFVHRERSQIKKDLDLRSVKQSTSSSLKDLIDAEKSKDRSLMQLIQGSATGESRDSAVDFPRTCIVPSLSLSPPSPIALSPLLLPHINYAFARLVRAMRRDRALRYRYLLGTLEARRRLLADALPHLSAPLLAFPGRRYVETGVGARRKSESRAK